MGDRELFFLSSCGQSILVARGLYYSLFGARTRLASLRTVKSYLLCLAGENVHMSLLGALLTRPSM